MDTIRLIDLKLIDDNPFQTRLLRDQAYIQTLADDIRVNTMLQTPIARFVDEDHNLVISHLIEDYSGVRIQLAFGHNRCEAYRLLSKTNSDFAKFPVIIRNLKDEEMALLAWSENENRKQLDPVERAQRHPAFY